VRRGIQSIIENPASTSIARRIAKFMKSSTSSKMLSNQKNIEPSTMKHKDAIGKRPIIKRSQSMIYFPSVAVQAKPGGSTWQVKDFPYPYPTLIL
jgi:hypothetical protein